jgi:hypothetical protein
MDYSGVLPLLLPRKPCFDAESQDDKDKSVDRFLAQVGWKRKEKPCRGCFFCTQSMSLSPRKGWTADGQNHPRVNHMIPVYELVLI